MLRRLTIKNFVLIENLSIDFKSGFTAITGETGSGKSILLHALGLLKGDRADFSGIGPKGNKSTVEGIFNGDKVINQWLDSKELEIWDEIIIRREIQKDGRSRAFINDTPVGLQELKELGEKLLIIHSQYNTLELKNREYQLFLLDALAGTQKEYQAFSKNYHTWVNILQTLNRAKEKLHGLETKFDYEQFILTEINGLDLGVNDYDHLSECLRSTEENIKRKDDIARLIEISEGPISQELESINSKLVKANENALAVPLGKINELMKELAFQASVLLEKIQSDADQEEDLLQKVDEFNRILNKHRLTSQEELKKLQHELEGRAKDLEELRGEIKIQESQYNKKEQELKIESKNLNKKRREALPLIQKEIDAGLLALKLEGSVLCFDCIETDTLNVRAGIDLNILFSANRGMEAIPIQKAASGGELSRVMLLLQQLISTRLAMPSILFDEIDTGVSGDVAEKIGKLLKEMGKGRQLYAITHLPQVAAQAENHLRVEKQDVNGRVSSTVIELQREDRVEEIARLMSGEEINEAAKQNARKLMGHGA